MILTRVTITGADDNTDIHRLFDLSDEFPNIEWGILIYPDKEGKPRYPTEEWRRNLMRWKPRFVKVAGHLCGSAVSNFFGKNSYEENQNYNVYDRIQLNFRYDKKDPEGKTNRIHNYLFMSDIETKVIIQQNVNNAEFIPILKDRLDPSWRPQILFDASGGKGKVMSGIQQPIEGFKCGYAGGISPENVTTILHDLIFRLPKYEEIWIDMETGVRTDNQFDLKKVRSVMDQITDFGS